MLSDEIKNRQPITTAIIACRECSCGYGYAGVKIVLTLSILSVSRKPTDCLSEPIKQPCSYSDHFTWFKALQIKLWDFQNHHRNKFQNPEHKFILLKKKKNLITWKDYIHWQCYTYKYTGQETSSANCMWKRKQHINHYILIRLMALLVEADTSM